MILADTNSTTARLDDLDDNPDNPRTALEEIGELAASIREQGVLTPLLVVEKDGYPHHPGTAAWARFMVVDGHRRLAALRHLNFDDEIPIRVVDMNRTDRILAAVTTQGRPLAPLDEARAFQQLIDLELTQRQIALKVGCNQSHVSKRLALLALPTEAATALADGKLTVRQAEATARGKPPAKAEPRMPMVERNELKNAIARLETDNQQLRQVAEKARAVVVEVRAELDASPAAATVKGEPDGVGWMVLIREHGKWSSGWDGEVFTNPLLAIDSYNDARSGQTGNQKWEAMIVALVPTNHADAPGITIPTTIEDRADALTPAETDALFDPVPADDGQAAWEAEHPELVVKPPWPPYPNQTEAQILPFLQHTINKIDTLRAVIAWELRHDNRTAILDAAVARLADGQGLS